MGTLKSKVKMDKELNADIRNKLQAPLTTLELLSQNKPVPKDFLESALKDIKKIKEMSNEKIPNSSSVK